MLSLYSGIGGLDLGLEWAGYTTVGQVEQDAYCRMILDRHWPEVPKHDDVDSAADWWQQPPAGTGARPDVDVVAGGFPCPGHSIAGRRLGTADPRWGWPAFLTVVDALRPPYVLVENVENLVRTGLGTILDDLAARRLDAEWGRLPAAAVGAPHLRRRLLILITDPTRVRRRDKAWGRRYATGHDGSVWDIAGPRGPLAYPHGPGLDTWKGTGGRGERPAAVGSSGWPPEPDVGRVAHGLPGRVDRLHALGNAVVPPVGEYAGRLLRVLYERVA